MKQQAQGKKRPGRVIPRDIYEYLSPIHKATADYLAKQGELVIQ